LRGCIALVALILTACSVDHATLVGTSSGGSGTTTGAGTTGISLTPDLQQVIQGQACDAGGHSCEPTPNEVWVYLDETDGGLPVCSGFESGAAREVRAIVNSGDGVTPIGIGQYAVVPWGQSPTTGFAYVDLFELGTRVASGTSGQLNITQVTPTLAGNLAAALNTGSGDTFGALSQPFDATWCGPAPVVDGGQDGGVADAGDGGICDIDVIANQLVGDGGTDCGSFAIDIDCGFDAGELAAGVACALLEQDAGLPFRLKVAESGIDTVSYEVYGRSATGESFDLSQSWINVRLSGVYWTPCGSFMPTELDVCFDGGVPDLSCQALGGPVTVCPSGS
jgi:hypothetical protein